MSTKQRAGDVMSRNVITVSDDMGVEELARFLTQRGISGAPVTDGEGKLVGVVSVTDIARVTGELRATWQAQSTLYHYEYSLGADDFENLTVESYSDRSVRDIMTKMVFDTDVDSTLAEVADIMVRGRIHRVFVVEDKKVVGVISALDLLQVVRES